MSLISPLVFALKTLPSSVSLALLLTGVSLAPALAQINDSEKVATYQGNDRQQRLIEGARKEGGLSLYSLAPAEDTAALVAAFEKKYGLKVAVWRAGSEEIRLRVINEALAGRHTVDIVFNNYPALQPLHRENLLQAVSSPYLADLIPQAIPAHREWAAVFLTVFVAAYNTDIVKKAEVPRTYRDLLDPKWKGKLAVESADYDWLAAICEMMGEAEALKLFREIAAKNGFSSRKGHTLLTNLIASGEVPLALTVFDYSAEQMKKKGAPLDWFLLQPLVGQPGAVGLAKHAPHPNAGVLFYDFAITEGQTILHNRDYIVPSRKVEAPLDRDSIKVMNPDIVLDEGQKWQQLYESIFLKSTK